MKILRSPLIHKLIILGSFLILIAFLNYPIKATSVPIVLDANSSATTSISSPSSLSWSHTVGTGGTNRLLLVSVAIRDYNPPKVVSSVTYGGQALTQVGRKSQNQDASVEMWYLVNPPTGTNLVAITLNGTITNGGIVGGASSWTGVNQSAPLGTFASAGAGFGTGTTASVNVTSGADEVVVDAVGRPANCTSTDTPGLGQTQLFNSCANTGVRLLGSSKTGASSTTMSWTLGQSESWAIGAVSIKPATVTTSATSCPSQSQLASYWKLDEATTGNASDSVGSNTLTASGTTVTTTGKINNARSFNSTSDYLYVNDPANGSLDFPGTGGWTVSAWVKAPSTASGLMMIASKDSNAAGGRAFNLYLSGGKPTVDIFSSDTGYTTITSTTAVNDDTWHHVAFVYNYVGPGTSTVTIYANGSPTGSSTNVVGPIQNSAAAFSVGARTYAGNFNYFNGSIDEVGVWKTNLSQTDITTLAGGTTSCPSALVSAPITLIGSNDATLVSFPTTTWTENCTGSNTMLIVTTAEWRGNVSSQTSNITYAGNSLIKLGQSYNTSTGALVTMWYQIAPATGTNNVVATTTNDTWSSDTSFASSCWSGVSQVAPTSLATAFNTSNTPSVAVTTNSGDMTVSGLATIFGQTATPINGQTQLVSIKKGNSQISHGYLSASGTSATLSWSLLSTADQRWAEIGAVLRQASSGGSTGICPIQSSNPRVLDGLISTPSDPSPKFSNTTGQCVISNQAVFVPYRIPTYEDLKSIYYTQAKSSKAVKTVTAIAIPATDDQKVFNYTNTTSNIDIPPAGLSYSGTTVNFIEGSLDIRGNVQAADTTKGLVLIVKGDINIDPTVTRIDAVLISTGRVYTAGANCIKNSATSTNQLVINGSLISFDPGSIVFCRSLNDNTLPAEKIIQQPKYLIILRNLLSDTQQKWSEIQ